MPKKRRRRDNSQQLSLFPSEEEQRAAIDEQQPTTYTQPQAGRDDGKNVSDEELESYIDYALLESDRALDSRYEVYTNVISDTPANQVSRWLYKEHGIAGGHTLVVSRNGKELWGDFNYSSKGIEIRIGDRAASLSWNEVRERIKGYILSGRFISEDEIAVRRDEYAQDLPYPDQNEIDKILLPSNLFNDHVQNVYSIVSEGRNDEESLSQFAYQTYRWNASREYKFLDGVVGRVERDQDGVYIEKPGCAPLFITTEEAFERVSQIIVEGKYHDYVAGRFGQASWQEEKPAEETTPAAVTNYRITNDQIGVGTPKERYANNIAAIKLLKELEASGRMASAEEQDVLAKYVGWGGLAGAFDEDDSGWSREYLELKELLTEEEYRSARASTLTAYYTPPIVTQAIYSTLERMGFTGGNVLEPAMGTGHFFGTMPEEIRNNSRLYGVELDSLTGRIAAQLYQRADIKVCGYEATNYQDNFFDAAVGNVPFGQYKVADARYNKLNYSIHDYYFAKTLDKVRPGGVVAFVTSRYTMDKENPSVRRYIAQRAELLGAVRLPNTAFKSAAGTEVVSDILFLQKRERVMDVEPEWI